MRCNSDSLQDCVVAHLAPVFEMTCETAGRQWSHGKCPACGSMSLSLAIKAGRSLLWTCHRKPTTAHPLPACEYGAILRDAASRCPGCLTAPRAPRPKRSVADDDLIALALSGIPPVSMKLAMLEMAGLSTPDALDKLGVRREHRSRVINGRAPIRVQNRR